MLYKVIESFNWKCFGFILCIFFFFDIYSVVGVDDGVVVVVGVGSGLKVCVKSGKNLK